MHRKTIQKMAVSRHRSGLNWKGGRGGRINRERRRKMRRSRKEVREERRRIRSRIKKK
jgi:hypothetical protein